MKVTETIEKEFNLDRIALTKLSDEKIEVSFYEKREHLSFDGRDFANKHFKYFDNLSDACNYFSMYLKELEK